MFAKFCALALLPACSYGYIGHSFEEIIIPNKKKVILPLVALTVATQAIAVYFFGKEMERCEVDKIPVREMVTTSIPFVFPYLLRVLSVYQAVIALAILYETTALVNTFTLISK